MAYSATGLKLISGGGKDASEGNVLAYSTTDTLATVKASGYFDSISTKLDANYTMIVNASDGVELMSFDRDSTGLILAYDEQIDAITDDAVPAIVLTTRTTNVTLTEAGVFTLANGTPGQRKTITMVVDVGGMTVTPATGAGYTTLTYADAGDSFTLEWAVTVGWVVIGQGGLGTGPVVS